MVTIIFESHGTSFDNEAHLASGWDDVELSPVGKQQSKELGARYHNEHFDAIFCSDLKRSVETATIAFVGRDLDIRIDPRLRECNYGDLTKAASDVVDLEKPKRIHEPFPNGESYEHTCTRMKSFLDEVLRDFDGKRIMIIGHRATQFGLEWWIKGLSIETVIETPWKWQPGWTYHLK